MEHDDAPEKALAELLQSRMIHATTSSPETIRYMRNEIARCACEDLCSACSVMYRWLGKMDPNWRRGSFRIIPGGKT